MRNFRDIGEKTVYETGRMDGFGEGLIFGIAWYVVFTALFWLTR